MSLKKRVIVALFFRNGKIVQSYNFANFKVVGNPTYIVERVNQWDLDELIYLDISNDEKKLFSRSDIPQSLNLNFQDAIESMSARSYAPLAVGGRIRSIDQVYDYLQRGADKVVMNSALLDDTNLIEAIVNIFGSQVLIAAVDYKKEEVTRVYKFGGREKTQWDLKEWLLKLEGLGVGEVLLNSIDKDGMKTGYDIEVINEIPENFQTPVILLGGAGEYNHFMSALQVERIHSVAAGNFFLHEDQSYFNLKTQLVKDNVNVRKSEMYLEKMKKKCNIVISVCTLQQV